MNRAIQGFTLIELMIAIAAFAVMMVGAINVINQGVTMRDIYFEQDRGLRQLQRTLDKVQADLSQIEVNRGVRDEYFEYTRAFEIKKGSEQNEFHFTKNSWLLSPYAQDIRSDLQRVVYRLEPMDAEICQPINLRESSSGFCLVREHRYFTDHYDDLESVKVPMLADIKTMQFELLIDQEGDSTDIQWQDMPVDLFRYPNAQALALKMRINSVYFGEFSQQVLLAETVFEVPNAF